MSQAPYNIADGDGATVLSNFNAVFDAIGTTNKGPTRPATIGAGMLWLDDNTPGSTVWTLNLYDGSEDVPLALIDTTTNMASYRADNVGVGTYNPIRPLTVASDVSAEIAWQDTGRPADQRIVRQWFTGGLFYFGALNDAGSGGAITMAFNPSTGHVFWGQASNAGPGIGNTIAGAVMFNDGANGRALILSRASQSPLFLNNNTNGGIATTYNCAGSTVGSVVVYSAYTAFNTSSDRRKKTYIKPYKDAGAVIDGLNVVSHGWRGHPDMPKAVGVLAQEAVEVFPAAVTRGDDNPDGKEGDNGFVGWQVDYSKFVPIILANARDERVRMKAVEELAGRVPALLSRIEALEAALAGKS